MSRTLLGIVLMGLLIALSAPAVLADDKSENDWSALRKKLYPVVSRLLKGEEQADPSRQEHLDAIDWEARSVTYQLWWNRTKRDGTFLKLVEDYEGRLGQLSRLAVRDGGVKSDIVAPMQRLFSKAVIVRAKEVISWNDSAIVGINAARVMYLTTARKPAESTAEWASTVRSRLGGDTGEVYANALTELIAKPEISDGVRYYLLRGLGDLLSLPRTKEPLLKKETEIKAVQAAMSVLNRKTEFPRNTPREELEGFKVLRWQALRVLNAAGQSEIGEKEWPALYLARAAGGDLRVVPPPRLSERLEGAHALGWMIARGDKLHPNLEPDYAAYQVALAVAAFGVAANENREAGLPRRVLPWKVEAARVLEAVNMMAKHKSPYVRKVADECRSVLEKVEKGELSPSGELLDWATRAENLPAAKSLIKGEPDTTVNIR